MFFRQQLQARDHFQAWRRLHSISMNLDFKKSIHLSNILQLWRNHTTFKTQRLKFEQDTIKIIKTRHTGMHFFAWKKSCDDLRNSRMQMQLADAVSVNSSLQRHLNHWRDFTNHMKTSIHFSNVLYNDFARSTLSKHFTNWKESAIYQKQIRSAEVFIRARRTHDASKSVFEMWRTNYSHRILRQNLACSKLSDISDQITEDFVLPIMMEHLKVYIDLRRQQMISCRAFLCRSLENSLKNFLVAWREYVVDKQDAAHVREVSDRMSNLLIRKVAFKVWIYAVEKRQRVRKIEQQIRTIHESTTKGRALQSWFDAMAIAGRIKRNQQLADSFNKQIICKKMIDCWCWFTNHQFELKTVQNIITENHITATYSTFLNLWKLRLQEQRRDMQQHEIAVRKHLSFIISRWVRCKAISQIENTYQIQLADKCHNSFLLRRRVIYIRAWERVTLTKQRGDILHTLHDLFTAGRYLRAWLGLRSRYFVARNFCVEKVDRRLQSETFFGWDELIQKKKFDVHQEQRACYFFYTALAFRCLKGWKRLTRDVLETRRLQIVSSLFKSWRQLYLNQKDYRLRVETAGRLRASKLIMHAFYHLKFEAAETRSMLTRAIGRLNAIRNLRQGLSPEQIRYNRMVDHFFHWANLYKHKKIYEKNSGVY